MNDRTTGWLGSRVSVEFRHSVATPAANWITRVAVSALTDAMRRIHRNARSLFRRPVRPWRLPALRVSHRTSISFFYCRPEQAPQTIETDWNIHRRKINLTEWILCESMELVSNDWVCGFFGFGPCDFAWIRPATIDRVRVATAIHRVVDSFIYFLIFLQC